MSDHTAKRARATSVTDTIISTIGSTQVLSKPNGQEYICTHSGSFHCDEALACGMLKLLPEYHDHPIVRTRDSKLIEGDQSAIVVDVGGVYDPARYARFLVLAPISDTSIVTDTIITNVNLLIPTRQTMIFACQVQVWYTSKLPATLPKFRRFMHSTGILALKSSRRSQENLNQKPTV